jgi:hypothetical protein
MWIAKKRAAGPPGPAGAGGGGFNGIQEFTSTGTFTVPPDTTHILAEMWGGGGGAQVCNRDQVETDTF